MNMVHDANNNTSEEAGEYRDWLGLADGEVLDLTQFSLDEVNERLRGLVIPTLSAAQASEKAEALPGAGSTAPRTL